jgi:hypothetical protein
MTHFLTEDFKILASIIILSAWEESFAMVSSNHNGNAVGYWADVEGG